MSTIPEYPTVESIRPVLERLPALPWHTLLQADVPDRYGHTYTQRCIDEAAERASLQVSSGLMPLHEYPKDGRAGRTSKVIGTVKDMGVYGDRLQIQVAFYDKTWEMVAAVMKLCFEPDIISCSGNLGPTSWEQMCFDGVTVYPEAVIPLLSVCRS